ITFFLVVHSTMFVFPIIHSSANRLHRLNTKTYHFQTHFLCKIGYNTISRPPCDFPQTLRPKFVGRDPQAPGLMPMIQAEHTIPLTTMPHSTLVALLLLL